MNDVLARFPSYGSCTKGEYRLTGQDLNRLQGEVFRACELKEKNSTPCSVFGSYRYLDSGWEWSVFTDTDTVIKVPAHIFPETSDPRYLENTAQNYSIIKQYVEEMFVAKTRFSENRPNIRQPLLKPIPATIRFNGRDAGIWRTLAKQLLKLLDAEEWLPEP